MLPVWAKRVTSCHTCGDDIPKGNRRIDELIKRNGHFLRLHRHPECLLKEMNDWFATHPMQEITRPGRGKVLDLTLGQLYDRKKYLSRLASLRQYYLPRLNLSGSPDELTPRDLQRWERFHERYEDAIAHLKDLGGIPERYARSGAETLVGAA